MNMNKQPPEHIMQFFTFESDSSQSNGTKLFLEVLHAYESRQIEEVRAFSGEILEIKPVDESHQAFLVLKSPHGHMFKVEVPPSILAVLFLPRLKPVFLVRSRRERRKKRMKKSEEK